MRDITRKRLLDTGFFLLNFFILVLSIGMIIYNYLYLGTDISLFIEYSILLFIGLIGMVIWRKEHVNI